LCPVSICPAIAARRHHLVSDQMGLDRVVFECAPAWKKVKGKPGKGKLTEACQQNVLMRKSGAMKLLITTLAALIFAAWFSCSASAQTMTRSPTPSSNLSQLEMLTKKIDEQNAKIDTLSQQILKLEQQISNMRPGVMIGEGAPATSTTTTSTTTPSPEPSSRPANGNSHVVARGETLTSIAKMYNVSVSELQRYNHIENDRKLQIGQTIMIPASGTATPSASPAG
jgi:LysM repeat protein